MRFISLILLFISLAVQGQKDFARPIIDTLCSAHFFGRGYNKDGVTKAADYLKDQLRSMELGPAFGNSYFQPLDHKVNVFTGTTRFAVGKTYQVLGKDFIQDPASGSFNQMVRARHITLPKKLEEDFIRDLYAQHPEKSVALCISYENWKACEDRELYKMLLTQAYPLVVHNMDRLVWGGSTRASRFPIIYTRSKRIRDGKMLRFSVTQQRQDFRSRNVAGLIQGTEFPDQYVILSAHYDHLGGLDENVYIPGANDNASGTAAVLNLAKLLRKNPPKYSVIVMFFAGEELGLLGSKYFVDQKSIPLEQIKFVLNLDLLGTGDEGFTVVNGTVFPEWMEILEAANEKLNDPLMPIKLRGEAANSDHYWFSKNGVPAFFIYTMGGITAYHDIYDKAKTLPLTRYNDMIHMLEHFVHSIP